MKITKLKKVDRTVFKPYKNITDSFRKAVIERNSKIEERDWIKIDGKVYRINKDNPDDIRLIQNSDENVKPMVEWLQKELGGKAFINPEPVSAEFRTADYMYRNQKWELKTKDETAIGDFVVYNTIKKGYGQANNFIIDFTKSPLTYEEILYQVDHAFNAEYINWFRKLIIKKGDKYHVFIRD